MYQEFPQAEYDRRLERIRAGMGASDLDLLLVTNPENYRYVTGHYTTTTANPARPSVCLLSAGGDATIVTCGSEERSVRDTSWITEISTYDELEPLPVSVGGAAMLGFEQGLAVALAEAARELGASPGRRIGYEFGTVMRLGLPLNVLDSVRAALKDTEFADASAILWDARLIKSELEVDCVREAVRCNDEAVGEVWAATSPGVSELELLGIVRRALINAGALDPAYTMVRVIDPIADLRESAIFGYPYPRQIEQGDLVFVDFCGLSTGYWSDYCRVAGIADVSDAQKHGYEIVWRALDAMLQEVRPGIRACEIASVAYQVFEEAGLDPAGFGRVGHGIGLGMPEPPSLHDKDETPLRAGMVLAIEPNVLIPGVGHIVGEEDVVVTDDGFELLSARAPKEVPVL